jgi:hypothetical protein
MLQNKIHHAQKLTRKIKSSSGITCTVILAQIFTSQSHLPNSKLRIGSRQRGSFHFSFPSIESQRSSPIEQSIHSIRVGYLIRMGFFDSFSDLLEAALPWGNAEAEAPKEDEEVKVGASLCLRAMLLMSLVGHGGDGMVE